ncbi:MAG: hypothetical protein ACOC0U_00510 [Desulfovibrionales bacterium]
MQNMWAWLREKWDSFRTYRKTSKELDPYSFQVLAAELAQLAQVMRQLLPAQHRAHTKLIKIEKEMEELNKLTSRSEFRRLTYKQKLQLKKNLTHSRDQLLEAAQSATPPTTYLQ